ncbi:MAG: alpha/beta hydrolase [Nannocystaceae bacterium]
MALALSLAPGCLKIPTESQTPASHRGEGTQASLVVWPGKTVPELYTPGEVRSFDILRGGERVGTSHGRYEGPLAEQPSLHRFTTRVEFTRPGQRPVRSAGEIIVDTKGTLVRGYERSDALDLQFERKGDTLLFTAGRESEELTYRDDMAYMSYWTILHEELNLGLRPLQAGDISWRQVSLSGSLPTEWSASVRSDADNPGAAIVETNLGERIEWQAGRITRITIDAETVEITPSKTAFPEWTVLPQTQLVYTPPADARFTIEPVELPGRAGEPKLVGEVLVPKGAQQPRAAVLWLSSNGLQDRHGFAGPPPVDLGSHEITDALANAGLVVLRFDERGQGESENGERSYQAQLEDARRALRTLLVQDSVNPDKVAVIGHGEGGWRALQLAGEGRGLQAVALLASPGRPYEILLRDKAATLRQQLPPEMREDAKAEQERIFTALRTGGPVPPELMAQADWIREILQVDPAKLVARIKSPMWVAQGGQDFEVDPQKDPKALVGAAKKNRKAKVTLAEFPTLDHLFKKETETSSPQRYLVPGRPVDPAFIDQLSGWLVQTLKAK